MSFPIERVRAQFPALSRTCNGRQAVYFDGPGGAQTLQSAIDAMVRYMTAGSANLHGQFPTSRETEAVIAQSRADIRALFNADGYEVAFGPNATTLMFSAARALARDWQPGDEILLTELEHHSNIDAWRTAAEDRGVTVRYIPVDAAALTLDLSGLDALLNEKTRLVALGLASNCVGTVTDLRPITARARAVGALVAADAVHAIPHFFVDVRELGIDLLFSSVYKFFGPHLGMAVIRKDILDAMRPYKVVPAADYSPDKLETGTQNHEGIAAIPAVVSFIASLGTGSGLTERVRTGYAAIEAHENAIAEHIRRQLGGIAGVTLYQAADGVAKTPTVAFRVDGISPGEFCRRMCDEQSVFIASGDFYAMTLADRLGLGESGGVIRAGMAPYNTPEEAERFLAGVRSIAASV